MCIFAIYCPFFAFSISKAFFHQKLAPYLIFRRAFQPLLTYRQRTGDRLADIARRVRSVPSGNVVNRHREGHCHLFSLSSSVLRFLFLIRIHFLILHLPYSNMQSYFI